MKAVYLCKKNQNFAYFLVFTKNSSSVLPLEAFLFFYFFHFFPGDLRLRIIENLPKPFGFFRKLIKTIDFSSCSTIWKSSFFYKKYENNQFLLLKTIVFFFIFFSLFVNQYSRSLQNFDWRYQISRRCLEKTILFAKKTLEEQYFLQTQYEERTGCRL